MKLWKHIYSCGFEGIFFFVLFRPHDFKKNHNGSNVKRLMVKLTLFISQLQLLSLPADPLRGCSGVKGQRPVSTPLTLNLRLDDSTPPLLHLSSTSPPPSSTSPPPLLHLSSTSPPPLLHLPPPLLHLSSTFLPLSSLSPPLLRLKEIINPTRDKPLDSSSWNGNSSCLTGCPGDNVN
ncbi:hypothetical protein EYF80_048830 [Liparis tanakae]|uniref:Uncharacterized protein n=1 Tax=Liparis tanakae TaxID=230148 RepID=A0A4Z2FJN7_9TELE|nr:hypothetical protein EYF80_048830 [Liparis tanakae]